MKILAVASKDIMYISTEPTLKQTVETTQFYSVADGNRWNKFQLVKCIFQILRRVISYQPQVIITTGSAPGLMAIIVGFCCGKKTIWIDSVANIEKVSTSGRIESKIATKTFTQWPHLASASFLYKGNVFK